MICPSCLKAVLMGHDIMNTRLEKRYDIYNRKYKRITKDELLVIPVKENRALLYKWFLKMYAKPVSLYRVAKLFGQAKMLHRLQIITKPLSSYTEEDVCEFLLKIEDIGLEKKWSKSTSYDYKRWLRQFFNYYKTYDVRLNKSSTVQNAKLMYRQLDEIKKYPQVKQKDRAQILDIHDLHLILSHCNSDRNKAIIALLYYTGWRIEGIATIRIKDIDFDRKCWTICVNDKTGEARLPIKEPIPFLKKYLESHPQTPDSWLFINTKGDKSKPLMYSRYANILNAIQQRIKDSHPNWDKKVNPHWFRHSWSTRNRNKYSPRDFNRLGKWAPGSKVMANYDHLNDEDLYDSFAQKNGVVANKTNKDEDWLCHGCSKVNQSFQKICSCGIHRFYSAKDENQVQLESQKDLRLEFLDKLMSTPELAPMWQRFLESKG